MSFTTNHDAMETVHRTLPIFLYNSIMISEESPNMGLNLFEPRYQCMCERICSRQMPPFILFVPNFEDYQPKPGDCGFVVHVNCQPSGGGQYSMHGRLVTTRRVIELSWVEPNTNGLFFALTSPLPLKPTDGSNYECDAIKFGAACQGRTDLTSTNWSSMVCQHIYNKLPTTTQINQATTKQMEVNDSLLEEITIPNYNIMVTTNHRDWRTQEWLASQIHVRSVLDSESYSYEHIINDFKIEPETLATQQIQNVSKAKDDVLSLLQSNGNTNHMMDRNVIAVLPPIPLCMTLKTVLTLLSINMSIDSLTGLNFFLTRFHLHVKPTLFFQERVDGGLYGKLPHSKMSLEIVDPTITHEIFPYITFSNSEISSRLDAYEYSVRIQQGYSVNIVVNPEDVSIEITEAKLFLSKCLKYHYWPKVKLLFAGAVQNEGTRMNRLPDGVVRLIASFFQFRSS